MYFYFFFFFLFFFFQCLRPRPAAAAPAAAFGGLCAPPHTSSSRRSPSAARGGRTNALQRGPERYISARGSVFQSLNHLWSSVTVDCRAQSPGLRRVSVCAPGWWPNVSNSHLFPAWPEERVRASNSVATSNDPNGGRAAGASSVCARRRRRSLRASGHHAQLLAQRGRRPTHSVQ